MNKLVLDDVSGITLDDIEESTKDVKVKKSSNKKIDEQNLINPIGKANQENNQEGFVCLGYNDSSNYVWSNFKNCLFVLTPKDLSKNFLINCFGNEYIDLNYTEIKGSGKYSKPEVNYEKLANDIINKCQKAGIYTSDKQKGKGIWLTKNGNIVVNSDTVFSTDPEFNGSRIQKDATYIYKGSLGINEDSEEATIEDRKMFKSIIESFRFSNKPSESNLMIGLIGQGMISGACEWRAHGYIHGEAGSGKSTLLERIIKNLWGSSGFYFDGGSTEAGIRQKIGINAPGVAIDETEPERGRIEGHLAMFRGASSGTTVAKGTTDQTGTEFTLKFTGLLAGVIPVDLRQADKGRFLQFKLLPLTEEDKKSLTDKMKLMINDSEKLTKLGQSLQMYLVNNFNEMRKVQKEIRDLIILENSARLADTYSTVIAISYIIQKGFMFNKVKKDMHLTPKQFLATFDIAEKSAELVASKDHDEMFETLMTYEISNQDNKEKMSIINYVYNAYYSYKNSNLNDFKAFNADLGKYGIRVIDSENFEILIDPSRNSLKDILSKTRFNNGNIKEVLSRLSGVEIIADPKMVGGIQKRNCIKITLNQDKFNYKKYEELRVVK